MNIEEINKAFEDAGDAARNLGDAIIRLGLLSGLVRLERNA